MLTDTLTLHKWNTYYSEKWEKVIKFILFLIALPFAYFIFIDISPEEFRWTLESWIQWLATFGDRIKENPRILFTIASFLLTYLPLVHAYFSHQRERVFLTPSGIRYQSPWPRFLQWVQSDWFVKWSQINEVSLKPATFKIVNGPLSVNLVLKGSNFHKKLIPCAWIDPNAPEETRPSMKWHRLTPQQTSHLIPHCPIVHYLNNKGIEVQQTTDLEKKLKEQPSQFALESNSHSLAAAILLIVFLLYGFIDMFLNQEIYVEAPLFKVYFWGGTVVFLLTTIWLIWGKVPKGESIVLALMVGGCFGFALYPGLLRINQFTDTQGLQTYQYVLQKDYSLQPRENKELPSLSFEKDLDYWSHFEWESIHNFKLRKGGLGFYQVDMSEIYEDMREYYRDNIN